MREAALKKLRQELADLSDIEHLTRSNGPYSDVALCLETLGRLPSEVLPRLTCREHAVLVAHAIVGGVYRELAANYWRRQGGRQGGQQGPPAP